MEAEDRRLPAAGALLRTGGAAGLAAGLLFYVWVGIVAAFTSSPLRPLEEVATVVGGSTLPTLLRLLIGLVVGLGVAAIFGAIFGEVIASWMHGAVLLGAGVVYGFLIFVVVFAGILTPIRWPSSVAFVASVPIWAWLIAHCIYGLALGWLVEHGQEGGWRPRPARGITREETV